MNCIYFKVVNRVRFIRRHTILMETTLALHDLFENKYFLNMNKPALLVLDYKNETYKNIEDVVTPICVTSTENDLNGICGIVLHTPKPDKNVYSLIERAITKNLPIFVIATRTDVMKDIMELKFKYLSCYYTTNYVELFDTIRKFFSK